MHSMVHKLEYIFGVTVYPKYCVGLYVWLSLHAIKDLNTGMTCLFPFHAASFAKLNNGSETRPLAKDREVKMGRESSVGLATGLDDPGIETQWGRDFPRPSRLSLGSTQPPVEWASDESLSQG